MKVQLSVDSEDCDQYPFPDSDILAGIFESEIESLWPRDIPQPEIAEISVSSLPSGDMREQNKMYRDVDSTTDVLSFPMWENDGSFVPDTDCPVLLLGDILLCPEKISDNAADNKKEYIEELCLVLAHSFLHLFGWDHDTEDNEANMWKRQEAIKSKIMEGLRK